MTNEVFEKACRMAEERGLRVKVYYQCYLMRDNRVIMSARDENGIVDYLETHPNL